MRGGNKCTVNADKREVNRLLIFVHSYCPGSQVSQPQCEGRNQRLPAQNHRSHFFLNPWDLPLASFSFGEHPAQPGAQPARGLCGSLHTTAPTLVFSVSEIFIAFMAHIIVSNYFPVYLFTSLFIPDGPGGPWAPTLGWVLVGFMAWGQHWSSTF